MKRCLSCGTTFEDGWSCSACGHEPRQVDGFLSFAPELAAQQHTLPDFETLARVEAGNFWFRARNRLIVWAVRRYFENVRSMLEIGCGTGFVLSGLCQAFPAMAVSGSEARHAGLGFASRRVPAATLYQMDARDIPFRDEYDVVGAFDVLEHIHEDEQVLAEMYRAVRKGGGILMTVPQHPFLWSSVDEVAGHVRRYRAPDLVDKVTRAGFRIVRKTSFVALLLPAMVASRLARGSSGGRQVAAREFEVGTIANAILERILDFERGLIHLGMPLPAGGSLLIVARKD